MKKNYAFAFVAFVLLATSLVFAQNTNTEAVEKMTGVRGIALRTFCSFSTLFGANNSKCFDANKISLGNTAAVGAAGVGLGGETPSAPTPTAPVTSGQTASIGGFSVPVAPQIIERTVIVQGTPGPQGPAGAPGIAGSGASGAFVNVPQVFWNGGGGSAAPAVTVLAPVSPLPGGALPGQVLGTDASGTPVWQYITLPSASGTPSILGSLANLFATNGLSLATTSTSTTLKLGGNLTEDTNISQDLFNFGLSRSGFSIVNQGTTTVPTASIPLENTNFAGLTATEGTHSLFAGLFRRSGPNYPLYEIQAFDSATNRQGYSAIGNSTAQIGVTNGTTTNQIRADFNRIRLSSTDTASSSEIKITPTTGVTFASSEGAYSFPRMDGATNTFLTTNGAGQLRYENISNIVGTSSTSTINAWGLNGNSGIDAATNFFGTTDAQDIVVKTNNVERARFTKDGNFGIGTSTPMRPLTVVGNVGGTLGFFQNTNAGAPAGISMQATRADTSLSTRIGWFVNPNVTGDDRLATHAVGTGDLWSFSKNGDLVGSLGTSFDQRNDAIPARLSVLANDARPTALFQNGAQSYLQIKNGAGAFPQSYNVGVEAVGGTFNIVDANTSQNRLSINRNGNVQIYNMLNVGSYGFGLGNTGDAGFGNSAAAYMRYVQRAHIADSALELYDYNGGLSTIISQSSAGTDTEFNRTNKDIDFRLAGMTEQNLLFADASANNVGIGTMLPSTRLEVNSGIANDSGFAFSQLNAGSLLSGTALNFLTVNPSGKVVLSGLDASVFATTSPAGTNGDIQFNQGGVFAANSNFNWDNALGKLLINTNTQSTVLDVAGEVTIQRTLSLSGIGSGGWGMIRNPAGNGIAIDSSGSVSFAVNGSRVGVGCALPSFHLCAPREFNVNGTSFFGGNVGIRTSVPTEALEVAGNIKVRTNDKIILENNTNSDWITSGPTLGMTRSGRSLQFWTASNVHMQINDSGDFAWNTNGSGDRTFEIRPSNGQLSDVLVMRQNPNQGSAPLFSVNGLGGGYFAGSVGIGTSTPRAKLDVNGDAWIGQVKISNSLAGFPSPTNAIEFWHGGNPGTGNNGTGIVAGGQTNGTTLLLTSANMDGSGQFEHPQLGRIMVRGNGGKMSFNAPTGIATTSSAFSWTVGDVSAAVPTQYERMVLTQDGSLGLGTSAPARKLHVAIAGSGQVARFQNADGTCNINPSIFLAFNCLSDRSLKKDIATLTPSLAAFAQLNPVNYHWNTEDSASPLQYGFIAQEIEAIFPSFVTTDSETGIKSVAFGNLIPVTVKAIQEMNAALGDLSKDTTPDTFADSLIYKRFADAFKVLTVAFKNITADKATVKELCLPKSDGTVICLSGDQVAAIAASAGVNLEPVVPVEEVEITPEPTPIEPAPIDPSPIEPMPVDEGTVGETPVDLSVSPGNPAPVEEVQPEMVVVEVPAQTETPAITE